MFFTIFTIAQNHKKLKTVFSFKVVIYKIRGVKYAQTLYELIEVFYEYKNETMDLITDNELISFMKKSFDGSTQGDLDYLSGTVMYKMRENLFKGKPLDYLEEGEEDE